VSTLLSDIPGAGDVLEGGFVSYAKTFKERVLCVDPETLAAETAVSSVVATEMAHGALRASPCADIAIAITGVCGPKPDEDGNPPGLAFVAIVDRTGRSEFEKIELAPKATGRVRGEIMERSLDRLATFLSR
jgi:PncC family amidohydrolase